MFEHWKKIFKTTPAAIFPLGELLIIGSGFLHLRHSFLHEYMECCVCVFVCIFLFPPCTMHDKASLQHVHHLCRLFHCTIAPWHPWANAALKHCSLWATATLHKWARPFTSMWLPPPSEKLWAPFCYQEGSATRLVSRNPGQNNPSQVLPIPTTFGPIRSNAQPCLTLNNENTKGQFKRNASQRPATPPNHGGPNTISLKLTHFCS